MFKNCSNLVDVKIPDSVEIVKMRHFPDALRLMLIHENGADIGSPCRENARELDAEPGGLRVGIDQRKQERIEKKNIRALQRAIV